MEIRKATNEDLPQILEVQKKAFLTEAEIYNNYNLQPLLQTLEELEQEYKLKNKTFLVLLDDKKIIASVRAEIMDKICSVQKLVVLPEFHNRGIGKLLMNELEKRFSYVKKFELFTGEKSVKNIEFYKKLGYMITRKGYYMDEIHKVFMEKENQGVV